MGERFVAGIRAAMAIAEAKTLEAAQIADRRNVMDRVAELTRGFDPWAETNRQQRRAASREKKHFRLKGVRP